MITFETSSINRDTVLDSEILSIEGISLIEKKNIIGETNIIQLALVATPVAITSLTSLIVTFIKTKKEFRLKVNGEEISLRGYSKKEIIEILSCYFNISND